MRRFLGGLIIIAGLVKRVLTREGGKIWRDDMSMVRRSDNDGGTKPGLAYTADRPWLRSVEHTLMAPWKKQDIY